MVVVTFTTHKIGLVYYPDVTPPLPELKST